MLKFILGVVAGAALAFGYVRFDVALPGMLQLPDKLRGNLVSTATEGDLYDLKRDIALRRRALEVYFANRAADATRVDAAAGHPFLAALYRTRASREARQLVLAWDGYDMALGKPALRQALADKHGTNETIALKMHMLRAGLDDKPFLKAWLARHEEPVGADNLRDILRRVGRYANASAEN